MIFNSFNFLIFFTVYFIANLLTSKKYKTYLIVIGSTFFYSYSKIEDIWIPFFLAIIGFIGGRVISNKERNERHIFLGLTLFILYLPLIFYKYRGFFYNDFIVPIFGLNESLFTTSIPLGISFITFTITSYLIDIFQRKFTTKINFDTFLAYILFFPQLIAGPILRPKELIPQLRNITKLNREQNFLAFSIFTNGIVKKVIFADSIAKIVEPVFDSSLSNLNSLEILLGIYGFSVQIYCDFSGYTDMAIGLGLLLGIKLPNNFLNPYTATSITDFWRKWHITLSNFLRDYLYIPLGGNRVILKKQINNILITMVIGGLWHGANWTFIFWGFIHGIGLSFLKFKEKFLPNFLSFQKYINTFITFNFITFAWIFFRADSLEKAFTIMSIPFSKNLPNINQFFNNNILEIILIFIFLITHKFDNHENIKNLIKNAKQEIIIPFFIVIWLIVISFSTTSSNNFIYFEF